MKYEHKVYSQGYALKVTPEDRSMDVMHFLITGHLLGDRSLEGVEWEEVKGEYPTLRKKRAKVLAASMRKTQDMLDAQVDNMRIKD